MTFDISSCLYFENACKRACRTNLTSCENDKGEEVYGEMWYLIKALKRLCLLKGNEILFIEILSLYAEGIIAETSWLRGEKRLQYMQSTQFGYYQAHLFPDDTHHMSFKQSVEHLIMETGENMALMLAIY